MAHTTTDTDFATTGGFWQRVGSWFTGFGHAVFVARGMEARAAKLQELQQKSDSELAEMGLRRDDLPAHVFRDVLYYL